MNTLEPLRYDHWEYVDLGIMVLSKTSYDELLNYIESLKGIEYDYLAIIFSQLLPYSLHSKDKLFCSEVVTILLQILHYEQVKGLKPHEVSPKDLARIFGLKG
jgi:Rps23 Pro-64 3,4-dihydroxylase Tpa1-like proline 4-hydroxylase